MKLSDEEFQTLKQKWYQFLKETGFNDIEEKDTRQNSSRRYENLSPVYRESKAEYYSKMQQALEKAKFKKEIDRIIVTRYSEGAKIWEICDELRDMGQSRDRNTVRWIIRKYEHAWKIRIYTRKQLHLKDKK